jgi:hypothetical protein
MCAAIPAFEYPGIGRRVDRVRVLRVECQCSDPRKKSYLGAFRPNRAIRAFVD